MEESGKPKIGEFIHLNDIKNNYYTEDEINSMIDMYRPKLPTPIGGKIFYDAGNNGATYTFYDSSGKVITDTSISGLQNAVKYKVEGTPSSDRFYVVYPSILNDGNTVYWGLQGNSDVASTGSIANTGTAIGTGKTNTKAILNYISVYASGDIANGHYTGSTINHAFPTGCNLYKNCGTKYNYLWDIIGDTNNNSLGGHNDWFIPSKDELYQIATSKIISSIVDSNDIWSSSTYSSGGYIWVLDNYNISMARFFRSSDCGCVACRSF